LTCAFSKIVEKQAIDRKLGVLDCERKQRYQAWADTAWPRVRAQTSLAAVATSEVCSRSGWGEIRTRETV